MAMLRPADFGSVLKRHRIAAGLTQEELAERAEMSVRGISDLERGVHRAPHPSTVRQLADALGLSPGDQTRFESAARCDRSPSVTLQRSFDRRIPESIPPLVGRSAELAALERCLERGLPVLLMAGEPGMGKSRLLHEAAQRASAHGFTVLEGGCQRRSGKEPYAPLPEILSRSFSQRSASQLRAALSGCGWLVRLLPELAEITNAPLPVGTLDPEQECRLVFAAVGRYLTNIAGPAGSLLVLDDLQWADTGGLDLLGSLVQGESGYSVRVIGAYRDTEVGPAHPLSALLAGLAERGLADHIMLDALGVDEATALLETLLRDDERLAKDEGIKRQILARADGLPFFLVSCAQGLLTGDQRVPWNLAQSIRQRIAALPDESQGLLAAAAVAGRVVSRSILIAMVAAPEGDAASLAPTTSVTGLDAACRARLLLVEGDHEYWFAHDVVREVIEADLGAAQRALLHAKAAQALEHLPERMRNRRVPEIAWHFLQGDDPERALPYTILAGDQAAAIFARAEAERHYRTALELARDISDAPREAEALEKLGGVLRYLSRYDEALELLEQSAQMYRRAGDAEGEGRVVAEIGFVYHGRGTPEEGLARLQPLRESFGASRVSMQTLDALYRAQSWLLFAAGRVEELLVSAQQHMELARAAQNDRLLLHAQKDYGLGLMMKGQLAEGLRVTEEVIPQAEAADDLETLMLALINAQGVCYATGAFQKALAYNERALELAERTSAPVWSAFALSNIGQILVTLGEWSQARDRLERATVLTGSVASWWSAYPPLVLGWLAALEGKWESARERLEEGIGIAERNGDPQGLRVGHRVVAELDLLERRPEAAVQRLKPLLGPAELEGRDVTVTPLLSVLAEAQMAMGDLAEGGQLAAKAVMQARTQNDHLSLVDALRVWAMALGRQGRWEEAEHAFEEAASMARALHYPYAEARALYRWGVMAVQGPDKARRQVQEALAIFQRLGAKKDVERAEQALIELDQG